MAALNSQTTLAAATLAANNQAQQQKYQYQVAEDTLKNNVDLATISSSTSLDALKAQLGAQTDQATIAANAAGHQIDVTTATQVTLAGIAADTANKQIASTLAQTQAQAEVAKQQILASTDISKLQISSNTSLASKLLDNQRQAENDNAQVQEQLNQFNYVLQGDQINGNSHSPKGGYGLFGLLVG
jgi:hypothetical protein